MARKKVKKSASKPASNDDVSCICAEGEDGFFYCYKKVQGKWVSCRGPYQTIDLCKQDTGEECRPETEPSPADG